MKNINIPLTWAAIALTWAAIALTWSALALTLSAIVVPLVYISEGLEVKRFDVVLILNRCHAQEQIRSDANLQWTFYFHVYILEVLISFDIKKNAQRTVVTNLRS